MSQCTYFVQSRARVVSRCARKATPGSELCLQHYKKRDLERGKAIAAANANDRVILAARKARRVALFAPEMLAMLERISATDALRNEDEGLDSEVNQLIKQAKGP